MVVGKKSYLRGLIYGLVSSATFGMIPLFAIPLMKRGLPTESILFFRFGISALLMGLIVILKGETFKVTRKELSRIVALGIMYASTANLLMYAYEYISSGMATTIHFLYPVMVTVVMFIFFKERSSLWIFVGITMAVAGVALMYLGDGIGKVSATGVLFALGTIVTYSLFIVGVNNSCIKDMDPIKMTFYVLTTGAIMFMTTSFISDGGITAPSTLFETIYIILLAIVPTLVSDLTLVLSIKHIGSTATAVLGSMEPVTAVIIGVLIFGEHFTTFHFVGILFVLIAVFILVNKK